MVAIYPIVYPKDILLISRKKNWGIRIYVNFEEFAYVGIRMDKMRKCCGDKRPILIVSPLYESFPWNRGTPKSSSFMSFPLSTIYFGYPHWWKPPYLSGDLLYAKGLFTNCSVAAGLGWRRTLRKGSWLNHVEPRHTANGLGENLCGFACVLYYTYVCVCVSVWAYAFAKLTAFQQNTSI